MLLQGCVTSEVAKEHATDCTLAKTAHAAKKLPFLASKADRSDELCHAVVALLGPDPLLKAAPFQSGFQELQADERFFHIQELVSDRHQYSDLPYLSLLRSYLIEDDFVCRFPIYASYFAERYQAKVSFDQCSPTVPFYLFDSSVGGYLVEVDPKKVREIHIVFASEGEGVGSSFGHVSIRLLVCPDVDSSSEECHRNLFEHVFLGYVARIDGFTMSLLKGVFGGYDAHLFGSTFREVYRTNTLLADRDLYSLPLVLDNTQIEQVVRDLSEIHWSYRGNYRFITANCATLLQDLLVNALTLEGEAEAELDLLRPDSLFNTLKQSDLARGEVLNSLEQAELEGYYFPRNLIYYQQAFAALKQSGADYPYQSIQTYSQSRAIKRLHSLLTNDPLFQILQGNESLLEAQLLLEERELMRLTFNAFRKSAEILVEQKLLEKMIVQTERMPESQQKQLIEQCYIQPLKQITMDIPRYKGIPNLSQLATYRYDDSIKCNSLQAQNAVFQTVNSLVPNNNSLMNELKFLEQEMVQTLDNIKMLEGLFL